MGYSFPSFLMWLIAENVRNKLPWCGEITAGCCGEARGRDSRDRLGMRRSLGPAVGLTHVLQCSVRWNLRAEGLGAHLWVRGELDMTREIVQEL